MTFGTTGWGADEAAARAIFDAYRTAGGNFIDTADVYSGGRSKEMLGGFIRETKSRDEVVLATKFGFNAQRGNPNAGGNGANNIHRALHGSLKRLGTDYIDLYWMHVWDGVTPVEALLQTLGDLVRAGKIRQFGLADLAGVGGIEGIDDRQRTRHPRAHRVADGVFIGRARDRTGFDRGRR